MESWGYDASGNRTGYTTGSTTKTSVFDELNRMTSSNSSGKSYTHDKVGNRLTTDEGNTRQTMGWDALNRMTTLTDAGIPGSNPMPIWGVNAEYYYRADGMRTMKVVHPQSGVAIEEGGEASSYFDFNAVVNDNTTLYGYDGQMCAEEFFRGTIPGNSAVNDDSTRYTLGGRGIDMIEAVRVAGASGDNTVGAKHWSFPLYDGHGNTIATLIRSTNSNGYELTNEKRYDVWGSVKLQTSGAGGALVNPNEGYCGNLGHKRDGETDLIYMRARYYEPGTGRFVSQDTAMDGPNWYSYCDLDPINYIDKSGRNPSMPLAWYIANGIALAVGFLGGESVGAYVVISMIKEGMAKHKDRVSAGDLALELREHFLSRATAATILAIIHCVRVCGPSGGSVAMSFGIGFFAGYLTGVNIGIVCMMLGDLAG